jgi:hypothetical protein
VIKNIDKYLIEKILTNIIFDILIESATKLKMIFKEMDQIDDFFYGGRCLNPGPCIYYAL